MSIRSAIAAFVAVVAALLAVLLTVTTLQLRTAGDRADAEARRGESIRLAETLRQSSNDLTRMVRLYVATGDTRYKDAYEEILAIRDGTAPRPEDYDNSYWDRVLAGTAGRVVLGPPLALLDQLRDAEFAEAEFDALAAGKAASDRLAQVELEVMAELEEVVPDLPIDTDDEAAAARGLTARLTDAGYHEAKDEIMASIEDMVRLVDVRTATEVADLQRSGDRLLWVQLAVIGAMAVVCAAALVLARRRIVGPLHELTEVTGRIAAGDYSRRVELQSLRELDLLGDRFNEMAAAIQGDIARREQAEAAALDAQQAAEAADRAKSFFLATMSHEIRTPLNAVLGMSEILQDSPLDADQRDCVQTIATSGDHLLGVINDILDFSKIESGMLDLDPLVFDLRRCVEDALDVVAPRAAEKRLDLVYDVLPGTPEVVRADRGRVRQILVNYLSNAVKFTERGDVYVEVGATGTEITVSVRDSGIGIPPERLDRLFREFSQVDTSTTRRYGGTGLGLAICKRLAELMGGRVGVDSHPGLGSIFTFTFQAEVDPTWAPPARAEVASLTGRRVLVVDDNATNRRILRSAAESWGMEAVDTAEPGEALARIDAGERYDLAVLDYLMPGMDGVALAAAIRQRPDGRELPLLLLSSVRRVSSTTSDFDIVLTKPVRRTALLDAFVELLAPEHATAADEAPVPERADAADRSALRILLAEDNAANQKVAVRLLGSLGYETEVVETGVEAVAAVESGRFDVVLMDVHMPEMDGLEATRRIRRLPTDRQPRIFAMTASALDSERQECLDAGMERHLAKPISRRELEEALADVTATAPPAATPDGPGRLALTLDELAESVTAEGVVEIIDAIVDDAEAATDSVASALAAADGPLLRRHAHTMKSNAAMVGAADLSDLCAEVEAAAKADDLTAAAPLVQRLLADYPAFVAALVEARSTYG